MPAQDFMLYRHRRAVNRLQDIGASQDQGLRIMGQFLLCLIMYLMLHKCSYRTDKASLIIPM